MNPICLSSCPLLSPKKKTNGRDLNHSSWLNKNLLPPIIRCLPNPDCSEMYFRAFMEIEIRKLTFLGICSYYLKRYRTLRKRYDGA